MNTEEGWNFALPIDNKYLGDDLGYGDCGFLILVDGVRAYHKVDHDDEIIFKGKDVKKTVPFIYDEDIHKWVINNDNTIKFDTVRELVNHVMTEC